jgi:predicted protein tyrosine phosphatase
VKPSIQITSLETARALDVSGFGGVITIEDSKIQVPFRVTSDAPEQLVLRFDDIPGPGDGYTEPKEADIEKAFAFVDRVEPQSLLIHCHAGISRSSAIALAIIARELGPGKEKESVLLLKEINPDARPNKLMLWMTDEMLSRDQKLYNMAYQNMMLTS